MIDSMRESGYDIVIGKGSFRQGSCVVLENKKIVLNSFLPLDLQMKFLYKAMPDNCRANLPSDLDNFLRNIK